jgi:processive rubber oxygenase RoxA-like protein
MFRTLLIIANTVVTAALVFTSGFLAVERTWVPPKGDRAPVDEFLYGSTGTEIMPLLVFQTLPEVFPEHFQPAGPGAGDWVQQFGFQRGSPDKNDGLPYGMFTSNYRPGSGDPSPIRFVGFNCSVCHTGRVLPADGSQPSRVVLGMGSTTIDLVPFVDALLSSALDPRLSVDTVARIQREKFHRELSLVEKQTIGDWLDGAREAIRARFPLRDMPHGGKELRDPVAFRAGPARNEPMKESVRFLMQRTPWPDGGPSKIPGVFMQNRREWAQFDGSLGDPLTRNSLAALGVGSSLNGLRQPGIYETIVRTSQFVATLPGPKFTELFPAARLDEARVRRGQAVYGRYCETCHGHPDPANGGWVKGKRQGDITPVREVGTDPSRVSFRYYTELGKVIDAFFPAGHPLKPDPKHLRPGLSDADRGYINSPLESVFIRAPYLHNGSVLNLAELLNLKPRHKVFYRGANRYSPEDVGLVSPSAPSDDIYFKFDTSVYGNGNQGHDYPWAWDSPERDEQALLDLIEYLKTF